jgi:hypothetical protein
MSGEQGTSTEGKTPNQSESKTDDLFTQIAHAAEAGQQALRRAAETLDAQQPKEGSGGMSGKEEPECRPLGDGKVGKVETPEKQPDGKPQQEAKPLTKEAEQSAKETKDHYERLGEMIRAIADVIDEVKTTNPEEFRRTGGHIPPEQEGHVPSPRPEPARPSLPPRGK